MNEHMPLTKDAMYQPKTVLRNFTKIGAQITQLENMLRSELPTTASALRDLMVEVHRIEKMFKAEQRVLDSAEAARELEDLATRKT